MQDIPPHNNVLKICEYIKKDVGKSLQLWLILELCKLGDLKTFVQNTQLDVKQKLDLFLQSSNGLNHLHKNKLVHQDIKLENILVHGPSDGPVIKIANFGMSRIIEREMTNMTALGTNAYMAPELYNKDKPSAGKGVDTFSLALTFWTILDPKDGSAETPRKGEHFSC